MLDIGTGSGYQAALLSRGVDGRAPSPAECRRSRGAARALGCANVVCIVADGWDGLPEHAPFDAIKVAAAAGDTLPPALERQLAVGGRLFAPDRNPHVDLLLQALTR